jgi:tRNA A-37 threonylcarbamoyl transferase component Bud32
MEMSGLSFELARLTGNRTRQETWLEGPGRWGRPVGEVCAHLDAIELDSLQLFRLPADYLKNLSQWSRIVKYHCQVADQSQSFYISVSPGQWLRTVTESPKPAEIFEKEDAKADFIIHSNVVPRQAYLKAPCFKSQRCRGFVPASVIVDGLDISSPPGCECCALAQQLSRMDEDCTAAEELDPLQRFWFLGAKEVEFVEDLGKGSEGEVSKIRWRKGVFVRKRFNLLWNMDRELDVALRVSHPNIVYCFGCSTDSTDCDLFMELLDVDLYRFLFEEREIGDESPFSFRDLLDVLLQVAQAMKHVHEMDFVHGDLKPHNIFLSCFEFAHSGVQHYLVKVGDFGCAQRVNSSGATEKDFECGVGTLHYTAPEVLQCRFENRTATPKHPRKIDVYSFGVVAYQVLTGIPKLYDGCKLGRSLGKDIIKGLRPDFNLNGLLDDDRSSLLTLIRSCWTSNPEDRPSFTEICAKLEGHVDKVQKMKGKLIILQSYRTLSFIASMLFWIS